MWQTHAGVGVASGGGVGMGGGLSNKSGGSGEGVIVGSKGGERRLLTKVKEGKVMPKEEVKLKSPATVSSTGVVAADVIESLSKK